MNIFLFINKSVHDKWSSIIVIRHTKCKYISVTFLLNKCWLACIYLCVCDMKIVISSTFILKKRFFLSIVISYLITGHGADVKCVHWHPQKGLIISGSKDNQQPVKLWDPKTGQSLATLYV